MNLFRVIVNLFRFNRTNWKAVTLCLLAAAFFWLFNALNKNYSTNVRFPLQFEFDRAKYIPVQPLPDNIYLNVNGNGWDLVRKDLGVNIIPLVISLEHPIDTKKIIGSSMTPLLAGQMGRLKINHVVTDTIFVYVELKDSVRQKLRINAGGITFKKGYGRISPIVVLPDSAWVQGPKSTIQSLPDSLGIVLPEKKLSGNFKEEVEVNVPEKPGVTINPPVVEVIFEVGQVTDVMRKIKLELLNIASGFNIAQETDSISCSIQIPQNRVDDFKQVNTLKAIIDAKDFHKGQKRMVPAILGLPPYAELLLTDSIQLKLY